YVDDDRRAGWIRGAAGNALRVFDPSAANAPAGDDDQLDRAGVDDPALLIYTSGTTGAPKGARLTHGNLLSSATAVEQAWGWTPDDLLLLTLPLFHVHGLGVGLNGALCAGSALELRPRFDLDDVLARCSAGSISMFFGVPTMYTRFASSGRASELSSLRLLVSGSAPLPPAVASEIAAAAGQIPLERYGMTETIMLTTNPLNGERRPGTVGFPFPGVSVRLAAAEPGSAEIQVRGPNVISSYYNRPDADAEAFTGDGWFRTGDLGEYDDAGYLTIIGRSKELIISGGFNVYPREVEERLLEFPGVSEVAVIGRPDAQWGEAVTAVVVGDVDPEALRSFAASALAPYKVPKTVEFVDALPRNALGKIVRADI
ncbi:MAG TPA: AMP-binding protein, partial [Isosphaeraceae bacterium]